MLYIKQLIDDQMKKYEFLDSYKEAKENLDGILDYEYILKHGDIRDKLFKCFFELSEYVLRYQYWIDDQS